MIHPISDWRTYDDRGVMMPWYTRPCLEWLDKLPLNKMQVFEYGCGASSLWYISRTGGYSGVDSNKEWLLINVTGRDDDNYQSLVTDKDVYAKCSVWDFWGKKIDEHTFGWYDIVVIDGLYRDDCTEFALKALKKGGYLIADNFEQASADLAHWPKTRELTKHLPLTIYKEPTHPDWQTAVWHNV